MGQATRKRKAAERIRAANLAAGPDAPASREAIAEGRSAIAAVFGDVDRRLARVRDALPIGAHADELQSVRERLVQILGVVDRLMANAERTAMPLRDGGAETS